MFLKILQNSEENTCVRVSFLIKLQVFFCEFLRNFLEYFFYRTPPPVAASARKTIKKRVRLSLPPSKIEIDNRKQRKSVILVDIGARKVSILGVFWSVFSRIRAKYGEINSISSYSIQKRENKDQKNSEYGHFSRSALETFCNRCKNVPSLVQLPYF